MITNDENDKQNFNIFYINFYLISLQLKSNWIEFKSNSMLLSIWSQLNLKKITKFNLNLIQVTCNVIQYFHSNGTSFATFFSPLFHPH